VQLMPATGTVQDITQLLLNVFLWNLRKQCIGCNICRASLSGLHSGNTVMPWLCPAPIICDNTSPTLCDGIAADFAPNVRAAS
jgi:hypothetical protein